MDMNLETFTKLIDHINEHGSKVHKLYQLGVDVIHMDDDYHKYVIEPLMLEAFGEEGVHWIEWFIYERPSFSDKPNSATDKNGNPICYDIPSLYEYVKGLKNEDIQ